MKTLRWQELGGSTQIRRQFLKRRWLQTVGAGADLSSFSSNFLVAFEKDDRYFSAAWAFQKMSKMLSRLWRGAAQ